MKSQIFPAEPLLPAHRGPGYSTPRAARLPRTGIDRTGESFPSWCARHFQWRENIGLPEGA